MTLTDRLLHVANLYCGARKLSHGRVSTLIFGGGDRLSGIAEGKDLNTRSFERAMIWFSANWPADLAWPEGIERPAPASRSGGDSGPRAGGLVAEVQP